MKSVPKLILLLSFLSGLAACQASNEGQESNLIQARPDSTKPGYPFNGELADLKQIQLRVYCGECMEDCETRYCLVNNNGTAVLHRLVIHNFAPTLPADCGPVWEEEKKQQMLSRFTASLPQWVTHSLRNERRLGCPDCADQCGYGCRLEFKSGKIIDFEVDTDPDPLSGDTLRWQQQISMTMRALAK